MYRSCLYCARDLGDNDVIEPMPIGRRIAFDAAKGRLWVICRSCVKWNLVPFESRLETIDACERLFRSTHTRYSTDNIGLARLREGLELVRVGAALRPEFAAWRYSDRFVSRRGRDLLIGSSAAVAIVGGVLGFGLPAAAAAAVHLSARGAFAAIGRHRIAARFVRQSGSALTLSQSDVRRVHFQHLDGPPGHWGLSVPERTGISRTWFLPEPVGHVLLTGPDATVALGQILPAIAGSAGSRAQVSTAVTLVDANPTFEMLVPRTTQVWTLNHKDHDMGELGELSAAPRLALEMLANEDAERHWLEGELKLLERQWQDADKLAAIADGLVLEPR